MNRREPLNRRLIEGGGMHPNFAHPVVQEMFGMGRRVRNHGFGASASNVTRKFAAGLALFAGVLAGAVPAATAATAASPSRSTADSREAVSDNQAGAIRALDRMSEFLRQLDQFQLDLDEFYEIAGPDDMRVQLHVASQFQAKSKTLLSVRTKSRLTNEVDLFDGSKLTSYLPDKNVYIEVPFKGTAQELLTSAKENLGMDFPAQHLFRWGTETSWLGKPVKAYRIGPDVINGWPVEQYAVEMPNGSFQIWLDVGDFRIPRRLVVEDRRAEETTKYTAELEWNLVPALKDSDFTLASKIAPGAPAPRKVSLDEASQMLDRSESTAKVP